MGKPLRWRYEVTAVWGTMIGRLEVGHEIIERVWKGRGEATWDIVDMRTHEFTGGWRGRYLGRYEGPQPPSEALEGKPYKEKNSG